METLNKGKLLIYGDLNYTKAINNRHMYNAPITLNFGPKHGRVKYIIGAGTSDCITLLKDGIFIYVLMKNRHLNYCGLEVINTETKQIEDHVFFDSNDIDNTECMCFDILNKDTEEQIKIFSNYLQ